MRSTMMDLPLSTQMIFRHGSHLHAKSRVGTYDGTKFNFASFAEVSLRVERLASVLKALGVQRGERIATYCWNHQAHLEAYLAVPAMGAVLHTLNVRLFSDQVAGIMQHAEDSVLIIDESLLTQISAILPSITSLRHIIVIGTAPVDTHMLGSVKVHHYEELLSSAHGSPEWPELDERDAAVVCYTSGTTGAPKGVVYSHRSIFLHTLGTLGHDTFGIRQADRILLLPSMFHANAWGLPFSAWLAGSDLLLPGPHLKASDIRSAVQQERPTFTALVPTLINDLLLSDQSEPLDMRSFRVIVSGGSAVSPALIQRVRERWDVPVLQGWGMTETSPMCCLSIPPRTSTPEDEPSWRAKSGRPVPGMEVRLVTPEGNAVPEDGQSVGELQLRGPWVTAGYHENPSPDSFTKDGWLRTGDVGTVDPLGYVQITDRTKDVIKSGGEWISSVELENKLALFPGVIEAAVIGIPDPRWEERPLVIVVTNPAHEDSSAQAMREFLRPLVAKFALPENFCIVPSLPKTSVGKIDKNALRKQFAAGALEVNRVKS
jgi:fatty-acyl-CoA synthase